MFQKWELGKYNSLERLDTAGLRALMLGSRSERSHRIEGNSKTKAKEKTKSGRWIVINSNPHFQCNGLVVKEWGVGGRNKLGEQLWSR